MTHQEKVILVPAVKTDLPIICNLARFYAYDMSEFYGDEPGWEMEDDGLYGVGIDYEKYFDDENAHPFLIRYQGELVGFAIVDKDSIDPCDFNMAQFFILRTYKNRGFGRQIAFACFKKFKGTWEVHVMPKNIAAYHFWKSVIGKFTHDKFSEQVLKNQNDADRIAFHFSSGEA